MSGICSDPVDTFARPPWLQLSGKLDVEAVLTHAEALAEHAGPRGRQLLATLDSA